MDKQINAPAGFWIRLLTKAIDFILPMIISVGILFALIEKNTHYEFKETYGYYVWTIVTVVLIITSFILIPYLTKGRTLAMYLTRIKIVPEDANKLLISLIKREVLFALSWVFLLLLSMAVINHTLVNEFARNDQKNVVYSDTDNIRIGIVSSAGTIIIILQLIAVVGIMIKRDKRGFHDRASNTSTVWVNKFIELPKEKFIKQIQPRPVNDEEIEWITK